MTTDPGQLRAVAELVATAQLARQALDSDAGGLAMTERNSLLMAIQDAFAELVDLEDAGVPYATDGVDSVGALL